MSRDPVGDDPDPDRDRLPARRTIASIRASIAHRFSSSRTTAQQHWRSPAPDLLARSPADRVGRERSRPASAGKSSLLVNVEGVGDCVDGCEPKYKQIDRQPTDERQRDQAEARDSLARGLCSSDPRRREFDVIVGSPSVRVSGVSSMA